MLRNAERVGTHIKIQAVRVRSAAATLLERRTCWVPASATAVPLAERVLAEEDVEHRVLLVAPALPVRIRHRDLVKVRQQRSDQAVCRTLALREARHIVLLSVAGQSNKRRKYVEQSCVLRGTCEK